MKAYINTKICMWLLIKTLFYSKEPDTQVVSPLQVNGPTNHDIFMQWNTTQWYKRNVLIYAIIWMNLKNMLCKKKADKRVPTLWFCLYKTLEIVNPISSSQKQISCLGQRWKGLTEGGLENDGNVLYLDCGGDYTSVWQNLSKCTSIMVYINITSIKFIKTHTPNRVQL